jgi:hypothetical protein
MSMSDGVQPDRTVRRRPWLVPGLGLFLLLAIAPIGWYLLSPLFIDRRAQDDPSTLAASASGVTLAQGRFTDADAVHKGDGQAVLTRLPSGRHVLRFEQFRVTNGPDLYVYLSGHPAPRGSAQLHEAGDLEVAVLKGNVGDQIYELPEGFDPSRMKSVVIYCKRFTTVFSTAELRGA